MFLLYSLSLGAPIWSEPIVVTPLRYYSIVNTVSGINRWIASIVRRAHIVNLCEKIRQWKTEFKKTVPSYSSIPQQLVNMIYEWSVRRFHKQRSSSQAQVSYNIEQTDHIYKERPLNTVTWRISVSRITNLFKSVIFRWLRKKRKMLSGGAGYMSTFLLLLTVAWHKPHLPTLSYWEKLERSG